MVDDAIKAREVSQLVTVLTFALARIASFYDRQFVAGDIIRRLGDYICHFDEQKAAQAEAGEAKEQGSLM